MIKFISKFVIWLSSVVVITIIFGTIYVVAQQNYRQLANDPQIEIVENIARAISGGQDPRNFDSNNKTDIAVSLSPYAVIYDDQGKPIAGTGQLNGQLPSVPFGVLASAEKYGKNSVTWQPRRDVRSAIVVMPFNNTSKGFVLAGRSLRETEIREARLVKIVGLAWILSLVIFTLGFLIVKYLRRFHD